MMNTHRINRHDHISIEVENRYRAKSRRVNQAYTLKFVLEVYLEGSDGADGFDGG
jgi:hypothetical protein